MKIIKKILKKLYNPLGWLFLILFFAISYYILYIQSEKYQSKAIVLIKNLSNKQSVSSLGSMFLGQGDVNVKKDSEILTIYARTYEMYNKLNKDYNLTNYYASKNIDPLQRLYKDTKLQYWKLDKENLLAKYNSDLQTIYDDLSGTIEIIFYHTNAKIAKNIVEDILRASEKTLNNFEKINAEKLMKFLKKQEEMYRKKYIQSIKKIISYQNRLGLIDPEINIKAKSTLMADLQSQLIKLEVEYQAKRVRLTPAMPEIKSLIRQIKKIKYEIAKLKKELAGGKKNGTKLNRDKFDFELLKSKMAFNQELYRQTLLKVEDAKISATQSAKNFIIISSPTVAEQYTKPEKVKNIITLTIILFFMYGIIKSILSILREHKD